MNITPLSPEQRFEYLSQTLAFIRKEKTKQHTKKSRAKKLKPESQSIHDEVKAHIENIRGAVAANQKSSIQKLIHLAMDGVFMILLKESHDVPNVIYEELMELFEWNKNYFDSFEIADYLLNIRQCVTFKIVDILIQHYNKSGHFAKAISIFDKYEDIVTHHGKRNLLVVKYIEALCGVEQLDRAKRLCCEALNKPPYALSYDNTRKLFLKNQSQSELHPARSEDLQSTSKSLVALGLLLATIYHKSKQSEDAIAIAQALYVANPDNNNVVLLLKTLYSNSPTSHKKEKISDLLAEYLKTHPQDLRVFTSYMIFLIQEREFNQAQLIYNAFQHEYNDNPQDLRKINILHAWFIESPEQGKATFSTLIDQFPYDQMLCYLAIRYAYKIRDRDWRGQLFTSVNDKFSRDSEFMELIHSLSDTNIICAVLENDYLTPFDLLQETPPKATVSYRSCQMPDVIVDAFQRFCLCETKPCNQGCLDNVYLIGQAVPQCMDWSTAQQNNTPLTIEDKLNDLDFVMQVADVALNTTFPKFKRNLMIQNLWTYTPDESEHAPSIDLMLYTMGAGSEDDPYDITETILKKRDLTINMLLLDAKGRVWDYIQGDAFWAYDTRCLKTYNEPHACLTEDPTRVLRIIKKLIPKNDGLNYTLDTSLKKALHEFSPPNWFNDRRLAKKFYDRLLDETHHDAFITLMREYNLLGSDINSSGSNDDVLTSCFEAAARDYLRYNERVMVESSLINRIDALKSRLELHEQIMNAEQTLKGLDSKLNTLKKLSTAQKKLAQNNKLTTKEPALTEEQLLLNQKQNIEINNELLKTNINDLNDALNAAQQRTIDLAKANAYLRRSSISFFAQSDTQALSPPQQKNNVPIFNNYPWRITDCDIDNLRDVTKYTHNRFFSAFIFLQLGCYHLYNNHKPLLAWYYLTLVEKRLIACGEEDEQFTIFLKNQLNPLLVTALQQSGLEKMNVASLSKRLKLATTESSEKPIKSERILNNQHDTLESCDIKAAYLEYYLKLMNHEPAAVRIALQSNIQIRSDFVNFFMLYNEALNHKILEGFDHVEFSDYVVKATKFSPYSALSAFIENSHAKVVVQYSHYIASMSLIQADNFKNKTVDECDYRMSNDKSIIGQCLFNLHSAEDYLTPFAAVHGQLSYSTRQAIGHYYTLLALLNTINDDKTYGFFGAWATARLAVLESNTATNQAYHPLQSILPIFSHLITQWNDYSTESNSVNTSNENATKPLNT